MRDDKSITLKGITLRWEVEYWEQIVTAYSNNKINCSEEDKDNDLQFCLNELEKAKKKYDSFIENNAEYFI